MKNLIDNDKKILSLIETTIGESLPLLKQPKWNSFGYTIHDNRISSLLLYGKPMAEIPERIWELDQITVLSLVHNGFHNLSERICELTILEELYLGGNQIKYIPSTIGKLSQLKYLYIYESNIIELPFEIANLTSLQELNTYEGVSISNEVLNLQTNGCKINRITSSS